MRFWPHGLQSDAVAVGAGLVRHAVPAAADGGPRQRDEQRRGRGRSVVGTAEFDRIHGHAPTGGRRGRRIGLRREVVKRDPRDGPVLIVERDRQGLLGLEATRTQRPERPFLAARRLDDPERPVGRHEREPRGTPERIAEVPDLDQVTRAWRELQQQTAMAPDLHVAEAVEMRKDRPVEPRGGFEEDRAVARFHPRPQRRRPLPRDIIDEPDRPIAEPPAGAEPRLGAGSLAGRNQDHRSPVGRSAQEPQERLDRDRQRRESGHQGTVRRLDHRAVIEPDSPRLNRARAGIPGRLLRRQRQVPRVGAGRRRAQGRGRRRTGQRTAGDDDRQHPKPRPTRRPHPPRPDRRQPHRDREPGRHQPEPRHRDGKDQSQRDGDPRPCRGPCRQEQPERPRALTPQRRERRDRRDRDRRRRHPVEPETRVSRPEAARREPRPGDREQTLSQQEDQPGDPPEPDPRTILGLRSDRSTPLQVRTLQPVQ